MSRPARRRDRERGSLQVRSFSDTSGSRDRAFRVIAFSGARGFLAAAFQDPVGSRARWLRALPAAAARFTRSGRRPLRPQLSPCGVDRGVRKGPSGRLRDGSARRAIPGAARRPGRFVSFRNGGTVFRVASKKIEDARGRDHPPRGHAPAPSGARGAMARGARMVRRCREPRVYCSPGMPTSDRPDGRGVPD